MHTHTNTHIHTHTHKHTHTQTRRFLSPWASKLWHQPRRTPSFPSMCACWAKPSTGWQVLVLPKIRCEKSDGICGGMGWLRLVGSYKLYVSFAKEPCKRRYSAKEADDFKGPTNRSHPIAMSFAPVFDRRNPRIFLFCCHRCLIPCLPYHHSWIFDIRFGVQNFL